MNAGITPYVFEDNLVRVHQDENGDPWFVAKDVCNVLGLQNSRDTLKKVLEDDEKGVATIYTLGGDQEVSTVSESGLYALIFKSRKPQAKTFRKWVTSEVLPAIRKAGRYEISRAEDREREEEGQIEALKELARSIPLRAAHRVQMMQLAERITRAEGTTSEVDILCRYLSLCEAVCSKPDTGFDTLGDEHMRQFVNECCEQASDADVVAGASLYQAYCAWCEEKGYKARSVITFGRQIGKFFERFKSNTVHYRGARLLN